MVMVEMTLARVDCSFYGGRYIFAKHRLAKQ